MCCYYFYRDYYCLSTALCVYFWHLWHDGQPASHSDTYPYKYSYDIMTISVDNCCTVESLSRLKGITVAHWNSRSLYPKFDEVTVWMDSSDLECLIISETWLTQDIPSDFVYLDGYNMYRHDRDVSTGKSRGGG